MKINLIWVILVLTVAAIVLSGCIANNEKDDESEEEDIIYSIKVTNTSESDFNINIVMQNANTNQYWNFTHHSSAGKTETIAELEIPPGKYSRTTTVTEEGEPPQESSGLMPITGDQTYDIILADDHQQF
jgi:hypothetical protein